MKAQASCSAAFSVNVLFLAACLTGALLWSEALAATVWTEASHGDLPGLGTIPSTTDFGPWGPGEYTVIGKTGVSGEISDTDVISFTTTDAFTIDIDALAGDDLMVRSPQPTGSFTSSLRQITSAPEYDIFSGTSVSAGDWYIDVEPINGTPGLSSDYTLTINVVPEPTAAGLLISGSLGLLAATRRRNHLWAGR